ncbi:MAG: CRISPR-associated helicase Cas3' [Dehalococcoidia bacterium]
MTKYWARPGQELAEHLKGVAELAAEFAEPLGVRELGYYAGLWHDIGKFDPEWQEYLARNDPRERGHGPDHKAAGAMLAGEVSAPYLGLILQAHHGGLVNRTDHQNWLAAKASLAGAQQAMARARQEIRDLAPATITPPKATSRLRAEMLFRLLFSALVDADSLDTEKAERPERSAVRGPALALNELWARLQAARAARRTGKTGAVNEVREEVYEACVASATQPRGWFKLTVPTGGGKTLSGMAFALRHAIENGHARVIVAVPYLTITEQTVDVYRGVFERAGDEGRAVLEHHSAVDWRESDEGEFDPALSWRKLAAENWDAPITVTTTVQLFDSLFARKRSACRKLHRLANSVVILDEAQALPLHRLTPIIDGLRTLVEDYGTTVVISTATQPAFDTLQSFKELAAHEIVPGHSKHFGALKRVNYEWRTREPIEWGQVAELMRQEERCLAVVNTKDQAAALFAALKDQDGFHLSTRLCGAHRRAVIAEVRERLQRGSACRLVSTQLIEAGVDLDFPLVLRALGPLDSIIQAAGRCNREGTIEAGGKVIVFKPTEHAMPPAAAYRVGAKEAEILLAEAGRDDFDPGAPEVFNRYSKRVLGAMKGALDRDKVQDWREVLDYPKVAELFHMIDEEQTPVVVTTYGSPEEQDFVREAVEQLRSGDPAARRLIRGLQPYIVSLYPGELARAKRAGLAKPVGNDDIYEWAGEYDDNLGLVLPERGPGV